MKGILAIYRRELNGYFVSPIAYIVIGAFLVAAGFVFSILLSNVMQYAAAQQMQAMQGRPPQDIDMPVWIFRGFVGFIGTYVLPILTPMLTMGVYAEERKRGTMEMLMTSPISELQIVIGKYLASLTLFVVMLAPTLLYYLAISFFSEPSVPWRIIWVGYLGLFLLGAVLLALGTFISSLTENQIIAGVVTFVIFLTLLFLDMAVRDGGSTLGEILKYISLLQHHQEFSQGVVDTTNIIFYLSGILLGLFLTLRSLDSMRWRRA